MKKSSPSKSKSFLARRHNLSPLAAIPFVLLSVFAIQSLWFIQTQSLTYDEPAHIIAGVDAWRHGRFERWNDHPPLGRLWLTLPLLHVDSQFAWQQLPTGYRVMAMQPGPEFIALHTRPMNTVLGLALGIALWFATRRLFSEGAANIALALFVFTPSLIAHFSVATTDGIGTLFIFLTAFQLVRWRHKANWLNTAVLGLVLGGLLLAKFYAPPLVLLALGLMLVLKPDGVSRRPSRVELEAGPDGIGACLSHSVGGILLPHFAPEGRRRTCYRVVSQPRRENAGDQVALANQYHRSCRRVF